jgi:diguanylate cyclase (GGDEF)-like protein/PAS domain S-box-containing protein
MYKNRRDGEPDAVQLSDITRLLASSDSLYCDIPQPRMKWDDVETSDSLSAYHINHLPMSEAPHTSEITELDSIPFAIVHRFSGVILYSSSALIVELNTSGEELVGQSLQQWMELPSSLWQSDGAEPAQGAALQIVYPPVRVKGLTHERSLFFAPITFRGQPSFIIILGAADQLLLRQERQQRIQYQEAVSKLGQQALVETSIPALMESAVALVAEAIAVDYVQMLQLLPNGYTFIVQAGWGWPESPVDRVMVSARPTTQAGYTLQQQRPVIVRDLQVETRFPGEPFLHNHHVVSGITVLVSGQPSPYGVLGVHTCHFRGFTQEDVDFLQAIANVLAAAIARRHTEDDLRLMKRAIAASSNGVVITDPHQSDNPVIYVNPGFERITGYSAAEMIGQNCRILQGSGTDAKTKRQIRKAVEMQHECHVTIQNYRKDGTPFWNELFIAPVLDSNGHLTNFIGIQTDITERRRAQDRLLNEYSLLNGIIQTNVAAVLVFNHSGQVIFANDRAEQVLGLTTSTLMQRHYNSAEWRVCDFQGVPLADEQFPFRRIKESGQPVFDAQITMKGDDGRVRYLKMNGAPLYGTDANLTGVVFSIVDVTEQRRIEAALRDSEQRLNSMLDSLEDVVWSFSSSLQLLYLSQAIETVSQRSRQDFFENANLWSEMIHPHDQAIARAGFHALLTTSKAEYEYRIVRSTGEVRWIRERAHAVYDADGQLLRFDGISSDVTQQKRAEDELRKSEQRLRLTFEQSPIGKAITTPSGQFVQMNRAFCQFLGYSVEELRGMTMSEVTHPDDLMTDYLMLQRLLDAEISDFQHEKRYRHRSGTLVYAISQVALIRDRMGKPLHIVNQVIDITERKHMEEQILHDALHDTLTELPNRVLFLDRLQQAMARSERDSARQFAVLFLDIDRFKVVNDSLGHSVGDQLLVAIAHRLQQCLRPGDTLARLGGDEFAILLDNVQTVTAVTHVAERIHQLLQFPFQLNGYDVFATASIGITLNGQTYAEAEDLLRDADTAMHRAKEQGRGQYLLFETDMYDQAVAMLEIESDLRRSLERNELRVFYQPIVCLESGLLSGFEALVRWQHSKRGLVSPVEFIPIAEETGLIVPIGMWVLEDACRQLQEWKGLFPQAAELVMSVNLSPRQLSSPNLVEKIICALDNAALPPSQLKLEITESGIMENASVATTLLTALSDRNIQLCIDDFGTGYSSLSRIHAFPIGTLKIDRSFVKEMMVDEGKAKIVQAIVALAHTLGMGVIAEGIETDEQLAILRSLGCDYGQGYLFAKPLPADQAAELLQQFPMW